MSDVLDVFALLMILAFVWFGLSIAVHDLIKALGRREWKKAAWNALLLSPIVGLLVVAYRLHMVLEQLRQASK